MMNELHLVRWLVVTVTRSRQKTIDVRIGFIVELRPAVAILEEEIPLAWHRRSLG